MKTAAIIAEFNPFHNGHAEIIKKARELTGCDYCLIIMSGDYVQRGTPAIVDRHTRCRAALEGGADLVISQPTRYATSSAENYALMSVKLLNALGCVDYLVFGSECGDLEELRSCAQFFSDENTAFQEKLREYTRSGISFPKARAMAAPMYETLLSSPNNVLAVEYLKALLSTGSTIEPVTIRRIGAGYNDDTSIEKYSSASAIRNLIQNVNVTPVYTFGSKNLLSAFSGETACRNASELHSVTSDSILSYDYIRSDTAEQMYFRCIYDLAESIPEAPLHTQIRSASMDGIVCDDDFSLILAEKVWSADSPEFFMQFADVSPDLARAVFNNRFACSSFSAFAETLKNKSITRTHINRALLHIALGIVQSGETPLCAQVLGCRSESMELLGEITKNSDVPVITRPARDLKTLKGAARDLLSEEIRVSNLYNMVRALKKKATVTNTLSRKFIRI